MKYKCVSFYLFVFQVLKRQSLCRTEKCQEDIPCVANTIFVSQIDKDNSDVEESR